MSTLEKEPKTMLEIKLTITSRSELDALVEALELFTSVEKERTSSPGEFKNQSEQQKARCTYEAANRLLKKVR